MLTPTATAAIVSPDRRHSHAMHAPRQTTGNNHARRWSWASQISASAVPVRRASAGNSATEGTRLVLQTVATRAKRIYQQLSESVLLNLPLPALVIVANPAYVSFCLKGFS